MHSSKAITSGSYALRQIIDKVLSEKSDSAAVGNARRRRHVWLVGRFRLEVFGSPFFTHPTIVAQKVDRHLAADSYADHIGSPKLRRIDLLDGSSFGDSRGRAAGTDKASRRAAESN